MKQLAAQDYEDLLQCSIPAFEGILDEPHNSRLMKLLYRTTEWHVFAKLRMHSDSTLAHLELLTKEFGLLTAMQIGRHVQRLECAQLVAERQKLKSKDETLGISTDDSIDEDLDIHYQISNTRRDPVNIYTYVRANTEDPAFSVHLSVGNV